MRGATLTRHSPCCGRSCIHSDPNDPGDTASDQRKPETDISSSLRVFLDGFEIAVNFVDRFCVEHLAPDGHSLVRTSIHDGRGKYVVHVRAVSRSKVPEIALGQPGNSIRTVA